MSSFTYDQGAATAILLGQGGVVANDLERRGRLVESKAKELCPVDNGTLRASITTTVEHTGGDVTVLVGSPLNYALYRHEGTGIYGPRGTPIVPVHATVLRWPTRGTSSSRASRIPGRGRIRSRSQAATGYAFARSVKGTPGVKYLLDALPAAAG